MARTKHTRRAKPLGLNAADLIRAYIIAHSAPALNVIRTDTNELPRLIATASAAL